jgi:hypothetical protein
MLRGICRLRHTVEGKIGGRIGVTERRGRRRKQLLDNLKVKRGYYKLKQKAPDRTVLGTRFGRGCGPVVRETMELIN